MDIERNYKHMFEKMSLFELRNMANQLEDFMIEKEKDPCTVVFEITDVLEQISGDYSIRVLFNANGDVYDGVITDITVEHELEQVVFQIDSIN